MTLSQKLLAGMKAKNAPKKLPVPPPKSAKGAKNSAAKKPVLAVVNAVVADDNFPPLPSFLDRSKETKGVAAAHRAKDDEARADFYKKNPPKPMASKPAKAEPKKRGGGVGATAVAAILAGKSNEEALDAVMRAHPDCSSNAGCMSWYRNKLRKEGKLPKTDAPKTRAVPAKTKLSAKKSRPTKAKK